MLTKFSAPTLTNCRKNQMGEARSLFSSTAFPIAHKIVSFLRDGGHATLLAYRAF